MGMRRLYKVISFYIEVMKQKHAEIQFEPVNKLTKLVHGTTPVINLD